LESKFETICSSGFTAGLTVDHFTAFKIDSSYYSRDVDAINREFKFIKNTEKYTYKEYTELDKEQNEIDCKPIAHFKNSMKEYFKRDRLCSIRPCYNCKRDNFIQLKNITKIIFLFISSWNFNIYILY
jgi:hypothetical protein